MVTLEFTISWRDNRLVTRNKGHLKNKGENTWIYEEFRISFKVEED